MNQFTTDNNRIILAVLLPTANTESLGDKSKGLFRLPRLARDGHDALYMILLPQFTNHSKQQFAAPSGIH